MCSSDLGFGFAHQVLDATNGCGIDVVMNAGMGDASLQESISCLKQHGRFLHLHDHGSDCDGDRDHGRVSLGLACFLNNITFCGININDESGIFTCNSKSNMKERTYELLSTGIQSGIVRPIQNLNVIEPEELGKLSPLEFNGNPSPFNGWVVIKYSKAQAREESY